MVRFRRRLVQPFVPEVVGAGARVDGIERDGRLLMIELECIEPQLFLLAQPGPSAGSPTR